MAPINSEIQDPATTEPTQKEPGTAGAWYESASDDYKNNKTLGLKDSETMDAFLEKHSKLSKDFADLKGTIPEGPEGYTLPLPEGVEDENQTLNPFFRQAAHSAGLSQEQATKLSTDFTAQMIKQVTEAREAGIAALKEGKTDQEFEKFKNTSLEALAKYTKVSGMDENAQKGFVAKYGDDPDMIRLMNFFGTRISEGGWVPGEGQRGSGGGTPEVGSVEYYENLGFKKK